MIIHCFNEIMVTGCGEKNVGNTSVVLVRYIDVKE